LTKYMYILLKLNYFLTFSKIKIKLSIHHVILITLFMVMVIKIVIWAMPMTSFRRQSGSEFNAI